MDWDEIPDQHQHLPQDKPFVCAERNNKKLPTPTQININNIIHLTHGQGLTGPDLNVYKYTCFWGTLSNVLWSTLSTIIINNYNHCTTNHSNLGRLLLALRLLNNKYN